MKTKKIKKLKKAKGSSPKPPEQSYYKGSSICDKYGNLLK